MKQILTGLILGAASLGLGAGPSVAQVDLPFEQDDAAPQSVEAPQGAEDAEADLDATVVDPAQLEDEAFVDGLMAGFIRRYSVPGTTLAFVRADGSGYTKGYGLADVDAGAAVSAADTRFYIGSISQDVCLGWDYGPGRAGRD